tara:strand:- start:377 stop:1213 length:837 start_codon:yes stop_codon:yes gene_type:complete
MDYHSDRFIDYSLLFYNQSDVLIAILPANIRSDFIISHEGLTYGGLVIKKTIGTEIVLSLFKELIKYLKSKNFKGILYKKVPYIYNLNPCDEDLYAMFKFGFSLKIRDASSTFSLLNNKIKGKKVNGYKKGLKNGFEFFESNDSFDVLKIVAKNLKNKYNLTPVHKPEEINLLKKKFPDNIKIFGLRYKGTISGGAIVYLNRGVVHLQYLTCRDEEKKLRGIDFLVVSIYNKFKNQFQWLNYGVSTENKGRFLNTGLIKSKEEFGFSTVCYDIYELIF